LLWFQEEPNAVWFLKGVESRFALPVKEAKTLFRLIWFEKEANPLVLVFKKSQILVLFQEEPNPSVL